MALVGAMPTTVDPTAPGGPHIYRLALRLGDLTLGRIHLRVLTRSPLHTAADGERDCTPEIPASVDGVIVRGQAVDAALPRWTPMRGAVRYVLQQYERCFVDLSGGFDAYTAKFSSRTRATLRRKAARALSAAPGSAVREFRTVEQLRAFHTAARGVSERTYQHRLFDSGLPDDAAFHVQRDELAARDAVRAFLLYIGEQPAAYLYLPAGVDAPPDPSPKRERGAPPDPSPKRQRGAPPDPSPKRERGTVLHYAYVGHDPQFASHSPGTVLLYAALERLMAEGRWQALDFTEGAGPHKEQFATHRVRAADLLYVRRTPRLCAVLAMHAACRDASHAAGRALEACGLKRRLKRWLRGGARGAS